jgi:hypothetical protein
VTVLRRSGELRQPALGLLGLLLVVPIAAALAIGAGGDGSVRVLAPLTTYALSLVAMVAFWWSDWPGTRVRASSAGWADTALIAAGAVLLTGVGQTLAGHLDLVGLFDPSPGPGSVPTFPATLPLAGTAFVAMLQLTLIGEGWPLAPGPSPRRRTPDARGRVDRGARRLPDPGRSGSASGLRGRGPARGRCRAPTWVRRSC